jgi:hypothetical protein
MPLSAHALFCSVRISRQSLRSFRQYATRVAVMRWRARFALIGGVRVRVPRENWEVTVGSWLESAEHKTLTERKHRAAHGCRGFEPARRWAGKWRTALACGKVLPIPLMPYSKSCYSSGPPTRCARCSFQVHRRSSGVPREVSCARGSRTRHRRSSLVRSLATRVAAVVRFAK